MIEDGKRYHLKTKENIDEILRLEKEIVKVRRQINYQWKGLVADEKKKIESLKSIENRNLSLAKMYKEGMSTIATQVKNKT